MPGGFAGSLLDGVSAPEVDVFGPLGYEPNPRQKIFHEMSQNRTSAILYGGSAGAGKTACLIMEAIKCAVNFPGMRIGCLRRSYPELEESFLAEIAKRKYAEPFGGKYNQSDHILRFSNGSIINFTFAANDQDASRLLGGEYQLFCIDEAGQMPASVLQHIEERLRSGTRGLPVIGLRIACLDEGDVLTESGWKPIQDVRTGERVYSTNRDGVMELKPVLDTFAAHSTDPLVRVRAKGLYMSMTQDHRVVYQDESNPRRDLKLQSRERTIDPTYRIIPWNQHSKRTISVARAPSSYVSDPGDLDVPEGWDADAYVAFMGLYAAEGCTGNPRRGNYKVLVTQCKVENQPAVRKLFEQLPYNFCLIKNGDFQILNKDLWARLRPLGKAHEKYIPRDILDHATYEQLDLLWSWMAFGDGHHRPSICGGSNYSNAFTTTSPRLADDVCEIAVKLGFRARVTKVVLDNPNHHDRYNVSVAFNEIRTTRVQKNTFIDHTSLEPFSGMVYCIKVADNENFVVRQGGSVWLSGNTNPGGVSTKYLKDRFIKPTNNGKMIHTDEYGRTAAFIPARYTDNPHIDPGYERILNSIPDPQRRAAMRDGDWSAMAGAFFEQYSSLRHVVPPFELPKEWRRYAGIDYGKLAPFACIWGAVDNDGRLWLYREAYVAGLDAPEQARLILAAERLHGDIDVIRTADPSMWGAQGTPLSIADMYGLEGCGITPAQNDRINGWARMHWYLNDTTACIYHKSIGWERCPLLHVFDGECPNWCEEISTLPRSKTKPDDAETTNVPDHLCDATRYLCMAVGTHSRPIIYDDLPSAEAVQAHNDLQERFFSVPEQDAPLVSQKYAGNLGLDAYLARQ